MNYRLLFKYFLHLGAALTFIMVGMVESARAFPNQINEHEDIPMDKFQNKLDGFLDSGIKPKSKKKPQFKGNGSPKKTAKKSSQNRSKKIRSDLKKLQVRAIELESKIQKLRTELEKNQNNL